MPAQCDQHDRQPVVSLTPQQPPNAPKPWRCPFWEFPGDNISSMMEKNPTSISHFKPPLILTGQPCCSRTCRPIRLSYPSSSSTTKQQHQAATTKKKQKRRQRQQQQQQTITHLLSATSTTTNRHPRVPVGSHSINNTLFRHHPTKRRITTINQQLTLLSRHSTQHLSTTTATTTLLALERDTPTHGEATLDNSNSNSNYKPKRIRTSTAVHSPIPKNSLPLQVIYI